MKNLAKFIIVGCTTLICIIGIVIGVYLYIFGSRDISEDPAQWGQFGDYIGGILNPILGIFNLVILIAISIHIAKIEEDRNARNLKPLGIITTHLESEKSGLVSVAILVKNSGLGPMIIKNISIEKNGENYSNFIPISKTLPEGYTCSSYENEDEGIISSGESITFGKFEIAHESLGIVKMTPVLDKIRDITVIMTYADIYGTEKTITKNLGKSLSSVGV